MDDLPELGTLETCGRPPDGGDEFDVGVAEALKQSGLPQHTGGAKDDDFHRALPACGYTRMLSGSGRNELMAGGLSCGEMRKTLSVAMIAMNEEANLPRTLESVKWADEIVVVDSGSKDRTIEIAESFGARTSYHAFGGHGEQKNVAIDLCTMDWVLLLDADEVLTPDLQEEIRQTLAEEPKFGAYWIPG